MSGYRGARAARLTAALAICLAAGLAHAEPQTVALLPLDAEARLEVYGQPVAAEIAKTLREGSIDVVVVGAKGSMPPTTKLIVDGSLARAKTPGAVVLHVRVRNPADGTTLENLDETASSLTTLITATGTLAQRLLPIVKTRLRAPHKPEHGTVTNTNTTPPPPPAEPVMLVGIGVPGGASPLTEQLRASLVRRVGDWLRASKRQPSPVDASVLGTQLATQTVASARAERGVVFEILDYTIAELAPSARGWMLQPQPVPTARARVRVRIADAEKIVFDEVIATDTIIGDRKMRGDELAARVAREVITILRPHMRRVEPAFR